MTPSLSLFTVSFAHFLSSLVISYHMGQLAKKHPFSLSGLCPKKIYIFYLFFCLFFLSFSIFRNAFFPILFLSFFSRLNPGAKESDDCKHNGRHTHFSNNLQHSFLLHFISFFSSLFFWILIFLLFLSFTWFLFLSHFLSYCLIPPLILSCRLCPRVRILVFFLFLSPFSPLFFSIFSNFFFFSFLYSL